VSQDFVTSADAARMLGVGPTSIKRWADSGLLPCVRTPGKHRRFVRQEVERFLVERGGSSGLDPDHVNAWIGLLGTNTGSYEVHSALMRERSRQGSWWQTAQVLASVLTELGRRWQAGEITVLQEHAASEQLARGLARACEALPTANGADRCLLATAEGDEHTLPLSLCELCLREAGWTPVWAGRASPTSEILALIAKRELRMVALSASIAANDAARLRSQAELIAKACRANGITLVLGGEGAWPQGEGLGLRLSNFREFHETLTELAR
jgi:excisionase family DNA binding protein